ncbi:MAG: hypothetical protein SV487_09870 [Thermodesulfobacteriota bacterium]|nr:hypothetical protein [Thermodesulfobacteriota bacterium]
MYNNIIYFILVLLVFTAYQPSDEPFLSWWAGLGLSVLFFYLYRSLVRAWFQRLQKSLGDGLGGGESSQRYSRLLTSLSILSLVFFTVNVYFLGLKDLILAVPLIGGSSALTGLTGLLIFALYLVILWSEAFAAYTAIYHGRLTRVRFVWSQIRFNLPIILPWLIISAAADLIALLPLSGFKEWLDSPVGQIVFFVAFMIGLVVLVEIGAQRRGRGRLSGWPSTFMEATSQICSGVSSSMSLSRRCRPWMNSMTSNLRVQYCR